MLINDKARELGIKSLYKYRSLYEPSREYTLRILLNSELMFSSPRAFNDPFEARPAAVFRGSRANIRKYIIGLVDKQVPHFSARERIEFTNRMWNQIRLDPQGNFTMSMLNILGECGILSLTTNPTHPLMWAHYASAHTGICLEFDATKHYFQYAQKVIYSQDYPTIDPLNNPDAFGVENLALLTKAKEWDYEDEFRVIFFKLSDRQREQLSIATRDMELRQIFLNLHRGHGVYSFPPQALTGVIFGCNTNPGDMREIAAIVRERYPTARLQKATRDDSHFRLNLVDL